MKSLIIIVSAILIYYLFVTLIVKFASERKLSKLNDDEKSKIAHESKSNSESHL